MVFFSREKRRRLISETLWYGFTCDVIQNCRRQCRAKCLHPSYRGIIRGSKTSTITLSLTIKLRGRRRRRRNSEKAFYGDDEENQTI